MRNSPIKPPRTQDMVDICAAIRAAKQWPSMWLTEVISPARVLTFTLSAEDLERMERCRVTLVDSDICRAFAVPPHFLNEVA